MIFVLFLFNILSITVALYLCFQLISIVKRGNSVSHDEILKALETILDMRNGTEESRMLTRNLSTMLMWKHENLESFLEDRLLPAIGRRVGSEYLKEIHHAECVHADCLGLRKCCDSSDPPTAASQSDDTSADDTHYDNGWYLLQANSYSEIEPNSEDDLSL
jgi:hypothetical protein